MQHQAQNEIYEETKNMTSEERLAYWQEANRAFEERMRKLRAVRKSA
jgi:ribosome recycling factor